MPESQNSTQNATDARFGKNCASGEFDTLNWPLSMLIWPHL